MNIHKTLTIFLMALTGFQITAMQQPNLRQLLINAAREGNVERVEQLMLAGAPVTAEALWRPTLNGNYDIVKTIFECGVDPESPADTFQLLGSTTVFMHLVKDKHLQPQVREKLIKLFLKHGADSEFQRLSAYEILIDKVHHLDFNTVKLLLEHGTYVNAQDDEGYTALMSLASQPVDLCQVEKAKLLIQHGADVNLRDESGATSLTIAVRKGNKPLVELLLNNGADVNLKLRKSGATILMIAALYKNKPIVELLLNNGADVNLTDEEKRTCLMRAVYEGKKTIVKLLLNKGAAVYLRDYCGRSALDYAEDNPEILKLLEGTEATPTEKFIRKALEYVSLGILTS